VTLQLPPCPGFDPAPPLCYVDHYNIGFGQREGSVGDVRGPIFSGQVERDGDNRTTCSAHDRSQFLSLPISAFKDAVEL